MHKAHLSATTIDSIVGSPEVSNQCSREMSLEKPVKCRRTSRPVDQIKCGPVVAKTPEPVRLACHPPAGFVGVQPGRLHGLLMQLLIPGEDRFLQSIPHLNQAAGRDFQLHMEIENVHDLIQRVAKGVVLPGTQGECSQADG